MRTTAIRWSFALLCLAAPLCATPQAAQAQSVAVFVNGEAVTTYDVEQRVRIAQRLDRKPISPAQALEECINDKLKIQEARRIGYRISDDDVNNQFAKFAQNIRQPVKQFEENLKKAGIDPTALKARTRADISWATIIQQRLRLGTGIDNSEVDRAAQEASQKANKVTEYQIQQVVFVVPAGAGAAVVQRRQKEAASAKSLFKSCGEGFDAFRSITDVAVKDPINRSSDALGEGANAMLSKTPVGGIAGPLTTEQGVELIAVCAKSERTNLADVRTTVENELFSRKSSAESERLLKEVRARAAIERKAR